MEIAAGRTAPLKSFLLAQEGVAGIGNIYADEALHIAAPSPALAGGLDEARAPAEALREGIVVALEAGLATAAPRSTTTSTPAASRARCRTSSSSIPARGKPCPRCGETIRRIVVSGRSTYFCPACQVAAAPPRRGGASGWCGERVAAAAGGIRGRPLERPEGRTGCTVDPRAARLRAAASTSAAAARHPRDRRDRAADRDRAGDARSC